MIYVDMDGVLVDWEGTVFRRARILNGTLPSLLFWKGDYASLTREQKKEIIRATPNFYRDLPWLNDGKKLWLFLNQYERPLILSAMSGEIPESLPQKYEWCKRELGYEKSQVIVTTRKSHKRMWSQNLRTNILIDDNTDNCNDWYASGGTAVHWINFEMSLPVLALNLMAAGYKRRPGGFEHHLDQIREKNS